jgi:drug/metabolite transporter (DMT)-like permease
MVYVLALGAALSNALTSVFQRMGVEDAPESDTMKLSLLTHALRRGVWLLGFFFMICGFLFQAFALHVGRLSVAQPILTLELLFLVFILGTYFGYKVSAREWIGVTAIVVGLAGFLAFAVPGGGEHVPTTEEWFVAGGIAIAVIVAGVVATRWGPRWWKAAMFGTAAAMSYAFTAALIKVVSNYAANDWVTILEHWQTYALIVFGLMGVFLTQNAFHAGPLAASQSTLVLVDPLFSILIGVGLYGDTLRTSGLWGPLEAISLLVMFSGAVFLSHSPLVTGIRGEGKGAEYEELLSRRVRHFGHSAPHSPSSVPDGGLPFSAT